MSEPVVLTHDLLAALQAAARNDRVLNLRVAIDKFDGDPTKVMDFVLAVELHFLSTETMSLAPRNKVAFVGLLLSGDPLQWFRDLLAERNPVLDDFEMFIQTFTSLYSDPKQVPRALEAIGAMKQKASEAFWPHLLRFKAQYRLLNLKFDTPASHMLYLTLSDSLKRRINAGHIPTWDWLEFIKLCQAHDPVGSPSTPATLTRLEEPSVLPGVPMDICAIVDKSVDTAIKKRFRFVPRKGKGKSESKTSGGSSQDDNKSGSQYSDVLRISSLNSQFTGTPFLCQVFLGKDLTLRGLLDCGATGCFISQSLVNKWKIPTSPRSVSSWAELANGKRIRLSDETSEFTVRVDGLKISVPIRFIVVPRLSHGLILGMSWLCAANPIVDWEKRVLYDRSSSQAEIDTLTACRSPSPQRRRSRSRSRSAQRTEPTHEAAPTHVADVGRSNTLSQDGMSGPTGSAPLPDSTHMAPTSDVDDSSAECFATDYEEGYVEFSDPSSESDSEDTVWYTPHDSDDSYTWETLECVPLGLLEETVKCLPDDEEPEDLSAVPVDYAEFRNVFGERGASKLPPHRPFDCAIEFLDNAQLPGDCPIYPLDGEQGPAMAKYIKDELAKGFIRPSKSPISSPVFFVPKADGSRRPCVDLRKVNSITRPDAFPMPLISELLTTLGRGKIFTKIDLRSAYNLVRIRAGDEWKTAFKTKFGLFEYCVMPFGLKNAPAVFQRLITHVFRDILGEFVIAYIDDILIFSANATEHRAHVRIVLSRLQEAGLYAKLSKCVFNSTLLEFLGFVISSAGIAMAESKVQAIRSWPIPKTRNELLEQLGLGNFYRRFIANYSSLVAPLTDLTSPKVPFIWTPACSSAFNALRDAICSEPLLRHYDPALPIVVETDASDFGLGGVLSQLFSGPSGPERHPIEFHSRKLSSAERNYDAHDKELLAVIDCLQRWRPFLIGTGQQFVIYSDHRNLVYFRDKRALHKRHARWSLILEEFNFTIVYRPGNENGAADALSRRPDLAGEVSPAPVPPLIIPTKAWPISLATITTGYMRQPINDPQQQLELIASRHDTLTAGHLGAAKTHELLARDFKWAKMREMVEAYCRACPTCQRSKSQRHAPYGLLQPLEISSRPWGSISLDFVTKLPISRGFDSILVVVCRHTKMVHLIPCLERISAAETGHLLAHQVFKLHGLPDNIVSDRGPQFRSEVWESFLGSLGINRSLAAAHHPQSDGQTERMNQTMEQILRTCVNRAHDNWHDLLPFVEFSMNNAVSSATGLTPFFANYGMHPRFTIDSRALGIAPTAFTEASITDAFRLLREYQVSRLTQAASRMKKQADKHRVPLRLQVGDKVWLNTTDLDLDVPSTKFGPRRVGPFRVLKVVNPNAVQLQLPVEFSRISPIINVSRLEPYYPPIAPTQGRPALDSHAAVDPNTRTVERILDSRRQGRGIQYLVRWSGLGSFGDTWEAGSTLANDIKAVAAFHMRNPGKPRLVGREGGVTPIINKH